jgi:hypothetical protein
MGFLQDTNSLKRLNSNTSFTFDHTVHANATYVIVTVGAYDNAATTISSVTIGGHAMSEAIQTTHLMTSGDYAIVGVYYIEVDGTNIQNSTLYSIVVDFSAKCTSAEATATDVDEVSGYAAGSAATASTDVMMATLTTPSQPEQELMQKI